MNVLDQVIGDNYALYCGDSAEVMRQLPGNSIDFSIYSPPFSDLYVYSASDRDLGNCQSVDQFLAHYSFFIGEIMRITKPGRITAVHVSDIPAKLARDGYIGLKDFSGDVIRAYIDGGWVFDARIPIDKNQQAQSIRTHAKGLTFQQLERDRAWSRPGLPDYILKFRKPGLNDVPVIGGDVDRDTWIEFANPTWPNEADRCAEGGAFSTWYGIRETETLQAAEGREADDERHICPLQLGTIERCVRLWSNPGETVLSPFAGIGSEVYEAVRLGRKGIGIELKPSYFHAAKRNLGKLAANVELPLFAGLMPNKRASS